MFLGLHVRIFLLPFAANVGVTAFFDVLCAGLSMEDAHFQEGIQGTALLTLPQ